MTMTLAGPESTAVGIQVLLEARDVEVVYNTRARGPVRAVAGVSLEVGAGEVVGLVGESGCGKSTLARALVGMQRLAGGSVILEGERVTALNRRRRPAHLRRLQMVFQNPYASLNPRRRIEDQIADALPDRAVLTRPLRARRVAELLQRVGLSAESASRFPHQFSGGQRHRIAIARALAADPRVIVLDEPLASLDASGQAQIVNLLGDLARDLKLGLLLISHDLSMVRHVTERLYVMYLGKIVEEGPTSTVWSDARHPYSAALIAAVPHADGRGTRPVALGGEVPDPARPPAGCRFHPRCPLATDVCREREPSLVSRSGVAAACWVRMPTEE